MNYLTYSGAQYSFSEVVDATGRIIQGEFLDHFSTTNYASWSYYDDRLHDLLSNSAFVSRYHTAQFRQFDAAIQLLYSTSASPAAAETFSTTTEWANLLSNTMYMIANINTRMNLLNAGISSIFESSNAFSESTYTLDYLSATYWPRGASWNEQWVPAPLAGNPLEFENATYLDDTFFVDMARLTLSADFDGITLDTGVLSSATVNFTPDLATDLSYTGQKIVDVNVENYASNNSGALDDEQSYLFEIIIKDASGEPLAFEGPIFINDISVSSLSSLTELSITTDFTMRLELGEIINPVVYPASFEVFTRNYFP